MRGTVRFLRGLSIRSAYHVVEQRVQYIAIG